jgi:hypothetical protein
VNNSGGKRPTLVMGKSNNMSPPKTAKYFMHQADGARSNNVEATNSLRVSENLTGQTHEVNISIT